VTVDLYRRNVGQAGSVSAEYAAESHFLGIEEDMRKFEKLEIRGGFETIKKRMAEGAEQVKSFENRYREVQDYRRPVWSLAARFRIGYAYEVYAKALLEIPPPPPDDEMKKLLKQLPAEDRELAIAQYEDQFRQEMEKTVAAMEDRAKAEYANAVQLAREGNITSEWTLLALERMSAYDPENYPRQHNGLVEIATETLAAPPLVDGGAP